MAKTENRNVEKKHSELETLDRCKGLLAVVQCELTESKTLEEAKGRINGLIMLMTMAEKLEKGNAPEFLEAIKQLVETDPVKAAYLAVHGTEMLHKAGID